MNWRNKQPASGSFALISWNCARRQWYNNHDQENMNQQNRLGLEAFSQKFCNCVRVPSINAQCFDSFTVFIQQSYYWICSSGVPHFQAWKFAWQITLCKCLYLWVPPQFSSADFENSEWKYLFRDSEFGIWMAALVTWFHQTLQAKLLELSTYTAL